MFLGEPPPTQADLHFRLFGFPVRVHPFFWLVTLVLGLGGDVADPINTLIWVAVVFTSILVHELGHAFLQRYYGGEPRITLYSFGGLASCDDCDRSPRAQILISLAGPLAGFLLAGLVIAVLAITGQLRGFEFSLFPVVWEPFDLGYYDINGKDSPRDTLILYLLLVNILWGVLNLLPIYPLDGGRIARELFTLNNARSGIIQSLQLSIGVAILVAIYALVNRNLYTCILFGLLAYGDYQALQSYRGSWR
ncbi:MAG TPA: site-2 protease family protein [Lacipirellulaceae bacterium]